jgi:hypothetical protein
MSSFVQNFRKVLAQILIAHFGHRQPVDKIVAMQSVNPIPLYDKGNTADLAMSDGPGSGHCHIEESKHCHIEEIIQRNFTGLSELIRECDFREGFIIIMYFYWFNKVVTTWI